MTTPNGESTPPVTPGAGGSNNGGGTEGGAGGSSSTSSGAGGDGNTKTVSHETYTRTMDQLKAAQSAAKAAEDKLKAIEVEAATKSGDVTKLLQIREAELNAIKTENEKLAGEVNKARKRDEARAKIGAILQHIPGEVSEKFFDKLPLKDIVVDPTTGKLDEASVMLAAKKFENEFPEVIKRKPGGMPMGGQTGGNSGGVKIHHADWIALPRAEKAKYKGSDIILPKR